MVKTWTERSGRAFYSGLLDALVQVMGSSNGYLFHHGPRVALLGHGIGREMGLDREELARILFGGVLLDLGMVGLVEDARENPVPELSPSIRTLLEEHPVRSGETVRAIPHLESVAPLVRAHHEWWDGGGYPEGKEGEEIPLGSRILRLADTVCALGEERPYRSAMDSADILRQVRRTTGSEFDPAVARAFFDLVEGSGLQLEAGRLRRLLLDAAGDLLPEAISDISTGQLLEVFGSLIDAKDPYTGGHSRRVAALAEAVARELGFGDVVQRRARAAGYLHDLGKVSVPLRILTKTGRLAPEERVEIERHPVTGATILESIPSLQPLTPACRHHHERWDGAGYPEGISRDRIPLMAQILAVCDAYDAMTSGRSYRDSRSHGHAMEEIDRKSGAQFGPRVVGGFLTLPYELFRRVELEDPADDRSPPSPFESPFHPRRRSRVRATPRSVSE